MIIMPDILLKNILDSILKLIKQNYVSATDKKTTFLYQVFETFESGNYNFYENAVKIFNRTVDDPRTIDTRILFDRERANLPTIHVTVPNEEPYGDGIGFDEGYVANKLNSDNVSYTSYYTRGYRAKYELVITGSNSFEVATIFYVLKCALINNIDSLEINGFRNPKIYGSDLKVYDQIQPIAFMRIITLDSSCELNVPKFESISIINNITFHGKPYEK
jgi:hypothetical protein